MKLSTKQISEKIKARELAKAAQAKEASELKKLEQAKSRKRAKFLSEVTEKALNAALEGKSDVVIGINCIAEMYEIAPFLAERFIEIEEMHYSEYLEYQVDSYLDSLDSTQMHEVKNQLATSSKRLIDLCEEIKKTHSEFYDVDYVVELFQDALETDEPLIERITSVNLGYLELKDALSDLGVENYSSLFDEEIAALSEVFDSTWLFKEIDDETTASVISWKRLEDDDVLDYEPIDDYLHSVGLGWLASTHGQLFTSALENQVDQKIEVDATSLEMRLYKFSSGYRVEFENGAEVYTLLDEVGFIRLFKKLGYEPTVIQSSEPDQVEIKISWA